jgi:hypothetical protein
MKRVEGDAAILHVDLEVVLLSTGYIHPVPNLALETYVCHQTLHGFWINTGQVPCVWITVWIAVSDIKYQDKIMAPV